MKVVIDAKIPGLQEGIGERLPSCEVVALEGNEITRSHVTDADALIVRTRTRCDASLLRETKVKLIGTATIGTDHIDLEWCRKSGIRVVNAPGCNAPAVMQYVAASLHKAGFDPRHDTLGLIGKGNIGGLVTDLYRRAGVRVLVCDPLRKDKGYADEDYLDLEEVIRKSDAVTFHVPYTVAGAYPTHHLIKHAAIGEKSDGPRIIVNASRGPVIDPSLLLEGTRDRKFIIDTWPFEEYPDLFDCNTRRIMINNAFIATPHIAGYSFEGKRRATLAMLDALEDPRNYVSRAPLFGSYNLEEAVGSFDPELLSRQLKNDPESFEYIRSRHLRPEPESI